MDWWHQLQGGPIAQERPPPPGADAPYPHLSQVPARPAGDDVATRTRIAAALAVDRADASYGTQVAPLPAPVTRPVVVADPDQATATIPAATPAPAAPVPVARTVAAPAAPAVSAAPAVPAAAPAMPDMPAAPPLPPDLPGVPRVTMPTPPPKPPPAAAVAAAARAPRDPVPVAFAAGSAVLPAEAVPALRGLAAARAGGDIVVAGFGEAVDPSAASQAGALGLGFARARAITAALTQAGVPMQALRVTAEAMGRGGVARLVQ